MELFFTSNDYRRGGIPFLLSNDMMPVREVNRWLRYVALQRGKTQSKATWRTYGYDSYYYFSWLEAMGKSWDTITEQDLAAYRNSMMDYPGVHGRYLQYSTINKRLTVVCNFYKWALKMRMIECLPFEQETMIVRKTGGFFQHLDTSGGAVSANTLMLKAYQQRPAFLTSKEIGRVSKSSIDERIRFPTYASQC